MAGDRKFEWRDGAFFNRVSGEMIPEDEPVIIFRARDRYAFDVLVYYLSLVQDEHHKEAVIDRLADFTAYQRRHPTKEPGVTRHIRLNSDE